MAGPREDKNPSEGAASGGSVTENGAHGGAGGARWERGATVVLMPFSTEHSLGHIMSTRGVEGTIGYEADDGTEVSRKAFSGGWRHASEKFRDGEHIVCLDSPGLAEALTKLNGAEAVLYIRGHNVAGGDALQSSDHEESISVTKLADLLQKGIEVRGPDGKLKALAKLDPAFPGKIKVYACESGKGSALLFGALKFDSFAQRLADEMYKRGYTACRFYGYSTAVSTYVTDVTDGKHKSSLEKNAAAGGHITIGRASEARVEVIPRAKADAAKLAASAKKDAAGGPAPG